MVGCVSAGIYTPHNHRQLRGSGTPPLHTHTHSQNRNSIYFPLDYVKNPRKTTKLQTTPSSGHISDFPFLGKDLKLQWLHYRVAISAILSLTCKTCGTFSRVGEKPQTKKTTFVAVNVPNLLETCSHVCLERCGSGLLSARGVSSVIHEEKMCKRGKTGQEGEEGVERLFSPPHSCVWNGPLRQWKGIV